MKMYIQIENNKPINNPILEEHLLMAYPDIDLNTDVRFKPFIRLPQPMQLITNHFQVLESNYVLSDGALSYTDSWYVKDMAAEEITQKTNNRIAGITSTVQSYIDYVNTNIVDADINDLPIWQIYLESITDFTYTDPFTAIIPRPPYKDKSGNWLSTHNSGAKPNVIG